VIYLFIGKKKTFYLIFLTMKFEHKTFCESISLKMRVCCRGDYFLFDSVFIKKKLLNRNRVKPTGFISVWFFNRFGSVFPVLARFGLVFFQFFGFGSVFFFFFVLVWFGSVFSYKTETEPTGFFKILIDSVLFSYFFIVFLI